ncbi:MAG: radical SAM protein [Clostridia bacterium]|nr:radical SAM protein [Clostridia bacterium]
METQQGRYPKLIHLLYVPTLFCNLGCSYCYLENQTDVKQPDSENLAVDTLKFAVQKFKKSDVLPYNISLHGGEVTTLKTDTLEELFKFIRNYYKKHIDILSREGFHKAEPHIKTNLYNFDKLYDLLDEYKVSVSASIDLPLSLHEQYRLAKNGRSTLDVILKNLTLLSRYRHRKKFSSVICYAHYLKMGELMKDIWFIHRKIGFDMNNFNFMFGFETGNTVLQQLREDNYDLRVLTGEEQVTFYRAMQEEFSGTELDEGLEKRWFEEFTPSYCTHSFNCGEKFFLLQYNGDIYSCVRGQGKRDFYFGNIYKDSVQEILKNAYLKIQIRHNQAGWDEECSKCGYLGICKTGCPFVKHVHGISKSYTCELQKEIYKKDPSLYPVVEDENEKKAFLNEVLIENHPQLIFSDKKPVREAFVLPNDFYEKKNILNEIIKSDEVLQIFYGEGNIMFEVNGAFYPLDSQILKANRQILLLKPEDTVRVHIKKVMFEINCREPVRNSLYMMLLRDTKVVYGDEKRTKQEHIFTHQVFYNVLNDSFLNNDEFFALDISDLLRFHSQTFLEGVLNNFFITTSYIREYHYQKQKENAFYHIQSINLPFQNIEFYWKGC